MGSYRPSYKPFHLKVEFETRYLESIFFFLLLLADHTSLKLKTHVSASFSGRWEDASRGPSSGEPTHT